MIKFLSVKGDFLRIRQHAFYNVAIAFISFWAGLGSAAMYDFVTWSKLSPSDWGTWAGAIGTLLAFAATVHLARTDRRLRRRTELELARVTAADFMIRLHHARDVLIEVCKSLSDEFLIGHASINYAATAEVIRKRCAWSTAELAPLTVLPNHAAAKLAMVQAVLEQACNILELAPSDSRLSTTQGRADLSTHAGGLIAVAIEAIKVAQETCKQFAEVSALADISFEDVKRHVTLP